MSPKDEDYQAVREVLGRLVTDRAVDKYVVKGWGMEGGFWVCVQRSSFVPLNDILAKLKAVQVDESVTSYSFKAIATCD